MLGLFKSRWYNQAKDRVDWILAFIVFVVSIPAVYWGIWDGAPEWWGGSLYNSVARGAAVGMAVWWASMWLVESDPDRHKQAVRMAVPMALNLIWGEYFFLWVLFMAALAIANEWEQAMRGDLWFLLKQLWKLLSMLLALVAGLLAALPRRKEDEQPAAPTAPAPS